MMGDQGLVQRLERQVRSGFGTGPAQGSGFGSGVQARDWVNCVSLKTILFLQEGL